MRITTALAAFLVAAPLNAAMAADPVGHYAVTGKSADGSGQYTGTVDVTITGATYKVIWKIADDTYIGTAIGDGNFLAVSYKSGSSTGLALYGEKGQDWDGIWAYSGATVLGAETWTRQ